MDVAHGAGAVLLRRDIEPLGQADLALAVEEQHKVDRHACREVRTRDKRNTVRVAGTTNTETLATEESKTIELQLMGQAASRRAAVPPPVPAAQWSAADAAAIRAVAGQPVDGLRLALQCEQGSPHLMSTYHNESDAALHLGFWWNVRMLVLDAQGQVVPADGGPGRPCGAGEDPTAVGAGEQHARTQYMACTQPLGEERPVGWSYESHDTHDVVVYLVYENPPPHGYGVLEANTWRGRVVSNPLAIKLTASLR